MNSGAVDGVADAKLGLRERKASATRRAIADALSERLRERSLSEITVEELAAAADVSRITFFNYFPSKEHVIDFLFAGWLFAAHRKAEAEGLRGTEVIAALFDAFGALLQESPSRLRQIMAFFTTRTADRTMPTLSRADRERLVPGSGDLPIVWPGPLFLQLLDEARRVGQPLPDSSDYEIGHLLGAILVGGVMVGHSRADQDRRALIRHHLRRTFGFDVMSARGKAATRSSQRSARRRRART